MIFEQPYSVAGSPDSPADLCAWLLPDCRSLGRVRGIGGVGGHVQDRLRGCMRKPLKEQRTLERKIMSIAVLENTTYLSLPATVSMAPGDSADAAGTEKRGHVSPRHPCKDHRLAGNHRPCQRPQLADRTPRERCLPRVHRTSSSAGERQTSPASKGLSALPWACARALSQTEAVGTSEGRSRAALAMHVATNS